MKYVTNKQLEEVIKKLEAKIEALAKIKDIPIKKVEK